LDIIRLTGLTKLFKGFRAVDNLNLNVREGIVFGFLGPNGAGKTTTIRMLAGILEPSEGKIVINGDDISDKPSEVKRCTGFIPDRPFLYEKLTGIEFLHFLGGLYSLNHSSRLDERIVELLMLFDLNHWGDELIESYSHGMKQRLVMCGALLHRPKLLIVDEPMVGLDPKGAKLVKDIFRDQAQNGTTVFMSTHSLAVAQEVCQEIAIIQAGKIIAAGTPEELKEMAGVGGDLEEVFLKLTEGNGIAYEYTRSSS